MFKASAESLGIGGVVRYRLTCSGEPLSFARVIDLWQVDTEFRTMFISVLYNSPFSAYRWETPPVTCDQTDRQFEFVLIDSPELALGADRASFAEHFREGGANEGIVVFQNLGRDSTLVVPSPVDSTTSYPHLGAFVRSAPAPQQHALWRLVGQTMKQSISNRHLWLSTAGGGVAWLHVRLDSWPKYYRHLPYKVRSTSDNAQRNKSLFESVFND